MRSLKAKIVFVFLVGWVVTAALGLLAIHVPFARDQGASAYVAWIMKQGGVVYRDVFHFNLPGVYFAYLAALYLPLSLPESVNLMQVTVNAVCFLLLYFSARHFLSPLTAAGAAFLFGLYMAVLYTDYWDIAEKESLACLPIALAFYGLVRLLHAGGETEGTTGRNAGGGDLAGEGNNRPQKGKKDSSLRRTFLFWALWAGLWAGAAAQFKPTLALILAAAFYPAWRERQNLGRAFLLLAAAGVGFLLSFIPLAVYLLRHQATQEMYNFIFRFGGFYGGQQYEGGVAGAVFYAFKNIGRWLYRCRGLAVLAVFGAVGGAWHSPGMRLTVWIGVLLLLQVIVQGKYFTYHFIPLLLPAGILAAGGGAVLWEESRKISRLVFSAVAVLVVLLVVDNLLPESGRFQRQFWYSLNRIDKVSFLKPYGRWGEGDVNPLASEAVARYLAEHSHEGDTIQILGHESGIYVQAGRRAATRYHFDQPFMTNPGKSRTFAAFREKMRTEFLADLKANRPVYIVVIEGDATGVEPEESAEQLHSFPELEALLAREYVLETKIEDFFLYRRMEERNEPERGRQPAN